MDKTDRLQRLFADRVGRRLSYSVLYLLPLALLMQPFALLHAALTTAMAVAAASLAVRMILVMSGRAQVRKEEARTFDPAFPASMFLCACVLYSQGRMSAGHLFLGLAAVGLVPVILLAIIRR